MPFTPPVFGNFGKNLNDLLKKKYDFNLSATTTNKTANGLTFETKGVNNGKAIVGSTKVTAKNLGSKAAEFEGEVDTSGTAKAKLTTKKLLDNTKVTVSGNGAKSSGALEVEYAQDFIAVKTKVDVNAKKADFEGSATIGQDGLSVGGVVKGNLTFEGTQAAVKDYNVGFQYAGADYQAALVTENKGDKVKVSYFHQVNSAHALGARFTYDQNSGSRGLELGTQYKVDGATTLKVKADTSGDVSTNVEHTLSNPKVKVNVSSGFDAKSYSFKTNKFGVGLSFGDY